MRDLLARVISWADYIISGTQMGYTSFVFIGCLAAFFVVFFLLRGSRAKRLCILAASLIFYVWAGSFSAFVIVTATAVVVYFAARRMETIYHGYEEDSKDLSPKERVGVLAGYKRRTRRYLVLALILIIAVWVFVKAGRLFDLETVGRFRDFSLFRSIIVPLGISYYTLSAVGYLLDIYWRKTKPEHNFLTLFTVMIYFPHIVEGPISKYQKLIDQMKNIPKFDYQRVCYGLQLMLWGYIKKMVIADRLALFTGTIFAAPEEYAGIEILLAVIFCAFELYADFSGCMDIVRGISEVLGINLEQNFRQPFFAKSAAEFWRRWHITLGNWTREYLYMPIATNPHYMKMIRRLKKKSGTFLGNFVNETIPMFVVWLFTGLWHGSGWSYIVWGMYWFLLMSLSTITKPSLQKVEKSLRMHTERWYYRTFASIRTFCLFAIGRMFTVAGGLSECVLLWKQLFSEARIWTLFDGSLFTHGLDQQDFTVAVLGIIVLMAADWIIEKGICIREKIAELPIVVRWIIYYGAIFAVLIFGIYGSGYDASSFIYGGF